MKILTLNINSIRAHAESFVEILRHGEYDTILVQELKVQTENFPYNLFDEYGYNVKVFGQKSWNGVATFSKYSIEDVTRGIPNYDEQNARMLECVIDGRIRLINVYMPNGEAIDSPKFPYKLEWMEKFGNHIKHFTNSEEPVIVIGDFNVAINDIDVWNPQEYKGSSISAPAAREIIQRWLDNGWRDEWRYRHPDEIGYTYYDYRHSALEKNYGLRLDYFLTNHAAQKMVKSCEIDISPRKHEKPTDHCGLVLEIK